jgi:hypothetical protein
MRILPSLSRPGALLAAFMTAATTMLSTVTTATARVCKGDLDSWAWSFDQRSNVGVKANAGNYFEFCPSKKDPKTVLFVSNTKATKEEIAELAKLLGQHSKYANKRLVDFQDESLVLARIAPQSANAAKPKAAQPNTMVAKAPAAKTKPTAVAAVQTKPAAKKTGWTLNLAKLKLPQARPTTVPTQVAAVTTGFVAAPATGAVPSVRTIVAAQSGPASVMGETAPRKDLRDILAPAQDKIVIAPVSAQETRDVQPVAPQAAQQPTEQKVNKPSEPLVASMPAVALRAGRSRITREAGRVQGRSRTAPTPNYPLTSRALAASKGAPVAVYG